jgi:hypothetical protein
MEALEAKLPHHATKEYKVMQEKVNQRVKNTLVQLN